MSDNDIPQFQPPRRHGKVIQPLSNPLSLYDTPSSAAHGQVQPAQAPVAPAYSQQPQAVVHPATPAPQQQASQTEENPALDIIRQKLNDLYDKEPNAKEEKQEAEAASARSKHQQFMYDLSHSGKSLAEIQVAWHSYYASLPDHEKHEVWHEFYAAHGQGVGPTPVTVEPEQPQPQTHHTTPHKTERHTPKPPEPLEAKEDTQTRPESAVEAPAPIAVPKTIKKPRKAPTRREDTRTAADVKQQLLSTVKTRSRRKRNSHAQSLLFGLSMGLVMIVVLLFGFFNERFIAPFMTPSRAVSNTPIIIDPNSAAVSSDPLIIIPKINVEIPVVYDEPSIEESKIQAGLERGVVHYATTAYPGEKGNGVIFGHSANNILNKGKYKFAFVLLKRLELGDTFYVQKDGKRYVYKVFDKKIVPPTDVSVIQAGDKPATMTLITCDPPGTSLNRLVVIGEQVSPDPNTNTTSTAKPSGATTSPTSIPGEGPTLWDRVRSWF
jgi:LPXTG-site transpeptidase (sortase) family protein